MPQSRQALEWETACLENAKLLAGSPAIDASWDEWLQRHMEHIHYEAAIKRHGNNGDHRRAEEAAAQAAGAKRSVPSSPASDLLPTGSPPTGAPRLPSSTSPPATPATVLNAQAAQSPPLTVVAAALNAGKLVETTFTGTTAIVTCEDTSEASVERDMDIALLVAQDESSKARLKDAMEKVQTLKVELDRAEAQLSDQKAADAVQHELTQRVVQQEKSMALVRKDNTFLRAEVGRMALALETPALVSSTLTLPRICIPALALTLTQTPTLNTLLTLGSL